MSLPFSGPGTKLGAGDIAGTAKAHGIEPEALQAVLTVETGAGGCLADGRPRILFEAHRFGAETGYRFNAVVPDLSTRAWNRALYVGGAGEYARLGRAIDLDRTGALRASSWGLGQILGSNHALAGFADVESYVAAMCSGEPAQLKAMAAFIASAGLVPALRKLAWADFARGYNGTAYRANGYDTKLAAAYALAKGKEPDVGVLAAGMRGEKVAEMQRLLVARGAKILVDGSFGRVTEIAVEQFQAANGLRPDGVAGPITLRALRS